MFTRGTRPGTALFDVVVNQATGDYNLTLRDNVLHAAGANENDATTNLHIMAYQYSFQWYQMGKGMAQAIVLLLLVVLVSYLLMRLWNRASESTSSSSRSRATAGRSSGARASCGGRESACAAGTQKFRDFSSARFNGDPGRPCAAGRRVTAYTHGRP